MCVYKYVCKDVHVLLCSLVQATLYFQCYMLKTGSILPFFCMYIGMGTRLYIDVHVHVYV